MENFKHKYQPTIHFVLTSGLAIRGYFFMYRNRKLPNTWDALTASRFKHWSTLRVVNGHCETLRDGEISIFLCERETFISFASPRVYSYLGVDYMANFSPGAKFEIPREKRKTLSLSMPGLKCDCMRTMSFFSEFQPGLKFPARFVKPSWKVQPGPGLNLSVW